MREDASPRAGVRDRQARESLRRRGRRDAARRLPATRSRPIPTSAFGGIIAFNRPVDAATLEAVSAQFLEVLIAPGYTDDALARDRAEEERARAGGAAARRRARRRSCDMKRVGGGLLVQSADARNVARGRAQGRDRARRRPPTQLRDLLFAWRVAKFVKSQRDRLLRRRAHARHRRRADEPRRLDAHRRDQGGSAGLSLAGSVVASDAFFPFRDGLDVVADNGAVAVIQPGGSMRDDEVIAAADERGIAMVFTGVRHFRH